MTLVSGRAAATMLALVTAGLAMPALATMASAQTIEALQTAETASKAAWEQLPLTEKKVTFVKASSTGYGMYDARDNNIFKPGEPIISYVEPVGFGWKPVDGGKYEIGFVIDLALKTSDGTLVSDQKGFMSVKQESHEQNQEYSIDMTLTLESAPPGNYTVTYTLHDTSSEEVSSFDQDFVVSQAE